MNSIMRIGNVTNEKSVHLADFPKSNKKLIDNKLEEKMDLVIELISSARNIREEAKIKVRQPISEVIFESKYKKELSGFEDLFKEELNVKNVVWANDMSKYVSIEYKPNFKEVGKLLGSNMSKFSEYLKNITKEDIKVFESGNLHLTFDGIDYLIDSSYVIKNIKAKEGYNAVMLNYKIVAINSTLTQDLINEGIAREIVSKVQNLRKSSNFNITDRIEIKYNGPKEIKNSIKAFKKYIMSETLALKLIEDEDIKDIIKINDYDMKVEIKQVK